MDKAKSKIIIFDLDGVIINSKNVQISAFKECYKYVDENKEPPYEDFFKHSGDSLHNIFMKMNIPIYLVEIYRSYSRKKIDDIILYDGVKSLLEYINKRGYKCAICTGKDRVRTIEILEKLKINNYFQIIVCSDDVITPKPSADSIYKCLELLNVDRTDNSIDIYMIGDATNDILAAKNAGVISIAITWGEGLVNDLKAVDPDYLCDNFIQLQSIIS